MINIALAGLGDFGSKLLPWVLSGKMEGVQVLYCLEPYPRLPRLEVPIFRSWQEIPQGLLRQIDVIVDCSTKGVGLGNLSQYRQLGIPAVFQSGEEMGNFELFDAWAQQGPSSRYLRIPKCSALMTSAVARSVAKVVRLVDIWAYCTKVNGKDRMLNHNYASGQEVEKLVGIPAKIDVVYLRGVNPSGSVYHAFIEFHAAGSVARASVIEALADSPEIVLASQEIDSANHPRGTKILAIVEGIEVDGRLIKIHIMSFAPEIDFPHNERAIHLLASR